MPSLDEASYTIFDEEKIITMTPEFDQQPPCGYTANMDFTWSIPELAPIYRQSDPYSLQVTTTNIDNDGIYTVFLENKITYEAQEWTELVSYDITISNPCEDTVLFTTNTTFEDITYELGTKALYKSFDAVTDTVTNGITTSGNCGNIVYTLFSSDTAIGTSFLEVTDLLNSKAIKI